MASDVFKRLFLSAAAAGVLFLSGCGDPVLDLSGSDQENAVRLAEFLKHYPEPDRVLVMGWIAADTTRALEKINGKKASEVLQIVDGEWKKLYSGEIVNAREIYRWAESDKVPVFGMKEFQDLCDNGIPQGKYSELFFRNAALVRSVSAGNECVPVYMEFLDQENRKNFHLDYYAPGNAAGPEELDDYEEFRRTALAEINGSYNRSEAIRELCDMSRNVRARTGEAVKAFTVAYPAEQEDSAK